MESVVVFKNRKKTSPNSAGPDWADDLTSELAALSTLDEVAKFLKISARQVHRYLRHGKLTSVRTAGAGKGSLHRIPRTSVAKFLRQRSAA
jgi:excisionase family DNA binding protein